ncbi:MAG TPA: protein kinase [Polyangia bacterium]|nr:protein kinase [Polyangia bacterium]
MEPRPREVLADKYRLVRLLGKGGMGQVWLADHLTLRCPVAIKLIDPKIANDADYRARFVREARAAAALRSPHVVQILDHGVEDDTAYIVMELLEGESLAHRLSGAGQLSPAETARVMTQVGRAATRAHEFGIVHRDLKPDNVFLVANDEDELAKVVDFGIAKATATATDPVLSVSTDTGKVLGTCYYMSPEQAAGSKTVDHRTDIWSIGVIAFECLLGERPFRGDTLGGFFQAIYGKPPPVPSQLGAVPVGFDEWFARACAHDPDARFPTAREACAELRRVCELAPGSPTASPSRPPPPSTTMREVVATEIPPTSGAMMASELVASAPRRPRGVSVALLALAGAMLIVGMLTWRRQAPGMRAAAPAPRSTTAPAAPRPTAAAGDPTRPVPPAAQPSDPAATTRAASGPRAIATGAATADASRTRRPAGHRLPRPKHAARTAAGVHVVAPDNVGPTRPRIDLGL